MTKRKLLNCQTILLVFVFVLCSGAAVYSADRLIIKDDDTNTTFRVQDNGDVYSAGFLGVGTESPDRQFQVTNSGVGGFKLDRPGIGGWLHYTNGSGGYEFFDDINGTTMMSVAKGTGYVGVGAYTKGNPAYPFVVTIDGAGTKKLAYCSAGGVWTDASSREYKENIESISVEDALDTLRNLDPVSYNYKDEKNEKYLGFIAEDVPEMVATADRNGMSAMDVVAVLTKVVQDQQEKMEELQRQLSSFEEKLEQ